MPRTDGYDLEADYLQYLFHKLDLCNEDLDIPAAELTQIAEEERDHLAWIRRLLARPKQN